MSSYIWVLVIAGLAMVACGKADTAVQADNSATVKTISDPYIGWEVHGEIGLYTVKLPPGWAKAIDDKSVVPRILRYENAAGNTLDISICALGQKCGMGLFADRVWQLTWASDSHKAYRVSDEGQVCTPNLEGSCLVGDGATEIHAMVPYGSDKYGGGHEYQFDFVSSRAESGQSDGLLRLILDSFRIA